MIPIPVMNRGTDSDIVNTEDTQDRIAGCDRCMVLGAEKDQMEGRLSSGFGSIHDKQGRDGRQTMSRVNGNKRT